MSMMEFLSEYDTSLLLAFTEHVLMIAIAVTIATIIGLTLGAWAARRANAARIVLFVANLIQTIPSIALFGLMIPVLALINRGVGSIPAIIALICYAQLPIIRNTLTALQQVPAATIDAARGLGMNESQIFRQVMLPLAAPGIVAGIRTAATMSVGVASVAAYIGAGGMGHFIQYGLANTWPMMTAAGAIGTALLALAVELLLELVERLVTPRGVALVEERP